jgi:hypothetical protein
MFDYYEKDHVIYRAPKGAKEVTEKQVDGHWEPHTRDPLPVEHGHYLGTGDARGDLEPDTGSPAERLSGQDLPRTA